MSNGNLFENIEVRALSWKNPYGPLMLPPFNKKETRTWNTNYRGLVLICASQQGYNLQQVKNISGEKQMKRIYGNIDREMLSAIYGIKGNAIAIGRLVDCHPMRNYEENDCFVAFREDLFVHVYQDVQPIIPFPFKGRQGWSKLSEEVKSQIVFKIKSPWIELAERLPEWRSKLLSNQFLPNSNPYSKLKTEK